MKIYLANPRGFCAGVDRAIDIVDLSLKKYGAPIYVRHEIVHSRHVVNSLRHKGAVFVEELNEVPEGSVVIFSAHGVAKSVWEEAQSRRLHVIDATCPLVIKVHNEVNRDYTQGYELILIGHAGHPEVIGTLGQIPDKFHLVSSVKDVEALQVEKTQNLSYVTQTTLSVDECRDIVEALHRRFPNIKGPHQEDICYATQNRQNAVKSLSKLVDVILVIGSPNSSNSNRLLAGGSWSRYRKSLATCYENACTCCVRHGLLVMCSEAASPLSETFSQRHITRILPHLAWVHGIESGASPLPQGLPDDRSRTALHRHRRRTG